MKAVLILEDGQIFEGERIGSDRNVICEMVFNTAVTGYVELLTDPSYAGQGVVMSSPIIGNYGVFEEDSESSGPHLEAFVLRYLTSMENDPRNAMDLNEYLKKYDIPGIVGVDTRLLTLTIREKGMMKGMLTSEDPINVEECLGKIRRFECKSKVPEVSITEIKDYVPGDLGPKDRNHDRLISKKDRMASSNGSMISNIENRTLDKKCQDDLIRPYKVALMDFGAKSNITRLLYKYNCDVTWYPWDTPAQAILDTRPDGIMLSNGPGDPKECTGVIREIKKLYDSDVPIFAICLGHQLMALAVGFDTYKLKYGHRGINHPVKDLTIDRCFITSQNHSYCVKESSIDPSIATVSHLNINDHSIEGLEYKGKDIFTVQFHPEGAPGPKDTEFLFERFVNMMEQKRKKTSGFSK